MQVPSIPPPIITTTLAPDVVAKTVTHAQAAAPLIHRAVDPAPKSEKSNHSRSNEDRRKGGGRGGETADQHRHNPKDSGSVDIEV